MRKVPPGSIHVGTAVTTLRLWLFDRKSWSCYRSYLLPSLTCLNLAYLCAFARDTSSESSSSRRSSSHEDYFVLELAPFAPLRNSSSDPFFHQDAKLLKAQPIFLSGSPIIPHRAPLGELLHDLIDREARRFCRGGNSLKVDRNCPTICCAGTRRYTWSISQS